MCLSVFAFEMSKVYDLTVVCKFEAFGQSAVGNIVSAYVVGEMYKICSFGTYPAAEGNSIINQLVAVVYLFKAEGIHD